MSRAPRVRRFHRKVELAREVRRDLVDEPGQLELGEEDRRDVDRDRARGEVAPARLREAPMLDLDRDRRAPVRCAVHLREPTEKGVSVGRERGARAGAGARDADATGSRSKSSKISSTGRPKSSATTAATSTHADRGASSRHAANVRVYSTGRR